ncbi:large conductance mechanosensitive channel protein MscL [Bifidobacterium aemilianum]|uniref:Large-conductance mechanosensitive channel n=1 Tax=Bifidobacterium aemilianum TaxID=2493120 RepID=A0A366K9C8_9BIFI|nr:large conductance mechanosensitive channel protein MscL [Bifidobacterium aemilianum]RBP97768.1 large conductance mechanosensitive channel protein MscL [Bifidobacterium aemilianum]
MIEGFKKFIARGNMIDLAVGVVMGSAVTTVVDAIVKNLINPLIAMIFGKPNMDGLLAFTFNHATISFGAILSALINFLVVAAAVYFCIIVPINKLRDISSSLLKKHDGKAAQEEKKELSPEEQTVALLQEIRDDLAKDRQAAR